MTHLEKVLPRNVVGHFYILQTNQHFPEYSAWRMNGYSPIYIQEKGVNKFSADSLGIYPVLWANKLRCFLIFPKRMPF